MAQTQTIFKIIVIGDPGVGKTTLTYRFCDGKFVDTVKPTIGVDFRKRTVNIDREDITLQLWDTAGHERFRNSMVPQYYRLTRAVILVYDVTNSASFNSLRKWIDEINDNCDEEVLKILVGNKCDGRVAVPTNVAQKFADIHNMPLFETSAKLDSQYDNVEAIFLTLAYKIKNHKQLIPSPKKSSLNLEAQNSNIGAADSYWYCVVL